MKKWGILLAASLLAASLTACSGNAKSNEWAKNVEIQVPAKAGGGTDVMARALATQVAEDSGNNLAIVNNTDGGGVVAMEKVRTAKKDGSTILQFHTSMLIKTATGVYDKTAAEDFTVIAVSQGMEKGSYVMVVPADSPYNTLYDLIEAAKAAPETLLFGVETGGSSHIQAGLIAKAAGISFKYVEAGSDTEKLTALVGKSIDVCLVNPNQAKQYVESGKVIGLGCVSRDSEGGRSSVLPEIPSFIEQGFDVSFASYNLFLGPKEMDQELVTKIYDYYVAAAANESVNKILEPAGFAMEFFSIEEGIEKVKAQQEQLNAVVEELGLKQK
ncbi:MAG: tripartite tricarboxylate transporter substrate binding protein [Clostridiaceae bacterium]|nr:tripartite tricarboxylate transporter substrate binding protein [Clostridiaceae bacterium]